MEVPTEYFLEVTIHRLEVLLPAAAGEEQETISKIFVDPIVSFQYGVFPPQEIYAPRITKTIVSSSCSNQQQQQKRPTSSSVQRGSSLSPRVNVRPSPKRGTPISSSSSLTPRKATPQKQQQIPQTTTTIVESTNSYIDEQRNCFVTIFAQGKRCSVWLSRRELSMNRFLKVIVYPHHGAPSFATLNVPLRFLPFSSSANHENNFLANNNDEQQYFGHEGYPFEGGLLVANFTMRPLSEVTAISKPPAVMKKPATQEETTTTKSSVEPSTPLTKNNQQDQHQPESLNPQQLSQTRPDSRLAGETTMNTSGNKPAAVESNSENQNSVGAEEKKDTEEKKEGEKITKEEKKEEDKEMGGAAPVKLEDLMNDEKNNTSVKQEEEQGKQKEEGSSTSATKLPEATKETASSNNDKKDNNKQQTPSSSSAPLPPQIVKVQLPPAALKKFLAAKEAEMKRRQSLPVEPPVHESVQKTLVQPLEELLNITDLIFGSPLISQASISKLPLDNRKFIMRSIQTVNRQVSVLFHEVLEVMMTSANNNTSRDLSAVPTRLQGTPDQLGKHPIHSRPAAETVGRFFYNEVLCPLRSLNVLVSSLGSMITREAPPRGIGLVNTTVVEFPNVTKQINFALEIVLGAANASNSGPSRGISSLSSSSSSSSRSSSSSSSSSSRSSSSNSSISSTFSKPPSPTTKA